VSELQQIRQYAIRTKYRYIRHYESPTENMLVHKKVCQFKGKYLCTEYWCQYKNNYLRTKENVNVRKYVCYYKKFFLCRNKTK